MPKLTDLTNDPDFATLSADDQFRVKNAFFKRHIATDPDFQALDEVDRQKVIQAVAGKAPTPSRLVQAGEALFAPVEAGATILSGIPATLAGGFAGLAELARTADPDVAAKRVGEVSEALTFRPRTRAGEVAAGVAALPFQALQAGAHKAGEVVTDITGSPELGTLAGTGLEFIAPLLAFGAAGAGARALRPRVPTARTFPTRARPRPAPTTAAEVEAATRPVTREVALEPAAQARTANLLEEAQRQTIPEVEGNPTLRAAQENILKGKPDVAEPVAAVELRREMEALRKQDADVVKPKAVATEVADLKTPEIPVPEGAPPITRQPSRAEPGRQGAIPSPESVIEQITGRPAPKAALEEASTFDLLKQGFGSEVGAVGRLGPEQAAQEAAARAARLELYRRAAVASKETGDSIIEAGKKAGISESFMTRLVREQKIEDLQQRASRAIESATELDQQARIVFSEAETIRKTGTISKELREGFREDFPKPETFKTRISEADVQRVQKEIIDVADAMREITGEIEAQVGLKGFELINNTLKPLLGNLKSRANALAKEYRKLRFAAGRTVRRFGQAVPPDVIEMLREANVQLDGLRTAQARLPLYTSILDKLKRANNLTPGELVELQRDLIDAYRLNLFSMGSFSLDLFGNSIELSTQALGGLSRDFVRMGRGDFNFASMQSLFRAMRRAKTTEKALGPAEIKSNGIISNILGDKTAAGEQLRSGFGGGGAGVFTTREGLSSTSLDYLVGTPLYLKSFFDSGSKRFAANMSLWEDAIVEANKSGLRGTARNQFFDSFFKSPPEASISKAIELGNKAGFNRPLTGIERTIAGSKLFKLFGEAFARWPFQFTRWAGEMLGYNQPLFSKFKADIGRQGFNKALASNAENIATYLTRTATGWGGLWLLNEMLYDNVDFNNMTYVHANGERTRLASRDPLPTALFFIANIRGDVARATGALRHASIPFARLVMGEGGILGSFLSNLRFAFEQGKLNPKGVRREINDVVNRTLPGQAILGAIESLFDPQLREGIGANVPLVSLGLGERADITTGGQLAPRQRFLGVELPQVQGVPLPGARILANPVQKLLSQFGLLLSRGSRQPIAGFPPGDLPEEVTREFEAALGRHRANILGPEADRIQRMLDRNPELLQNRTTFDQLRKRIQRLDARAARLAKQELDIAFGAPRKLPRQPTVRERRGPKRFTPRD